MIIHLRSSAYQKFMKVHITIIDDAGKTYDGTVELQKKGKQVTSPTTLNQSELASTQKISINIPENLIEPIMELDERKRIPILWSFSSQLVMTIEDFLNICADEGFGLNSSWLPGAGGNFNNRLVKEDKMFTSSKLKINGKKTWKLTDVGKLKIKKELSKLDK